MKVNKIAYFIIVEWLSLLRNVRPVDLVYILSEGINKNQNSTVEVEAVVWSLTTTAINSIMEAHVVQK